MSPNKIQRLFRAECGRNESAPSNKAVKKWYAVFQENGSVETPKKLRDKIYPKIVTNKFHRDPKQSLRTVSKKLEFSYGSVQKFD